MQSRSLFQCFTDNLRFPEILRIKKARMKSSDMRSAKAIKKEMGSFLDIIEK